MIQPIKIKERLLDKWIKDGELIEKYYKKKIDRSSVNTATALDWRSDQMHKFFLDNSFEGIDIDSLYSILDIGCGNCDVIEYLSGRSKSSFRYEGIDIVREFIYNARAKYASRKITIKKFNFLDQAYWPAQKFSLVLNLGGLNSKVRYRYSYLKYNIQKMILCSQRYVVFNLIIEVDNLYFKKNKIRKVGAITDFEEKKLIFILNKLSQIYNIDFKIKKVSIHKGSIDAFVLIKLL